MRRREFLGALGSVATWPIVARTQPLAMPIVGLLGGVAPETYTQYTTAWFQGLKESGYADGQNIRVEQRWAHGQLGQLPALIAELIQRRVNVIATLGGTSVAIAAKRTGTTTPIVFSVGSDPVEDGLVASLNRPGDTITGVTFFTNALSGKRLELLREIAPSAKLVAALVNPQNARAERDTADLALAAARIGLGIEVLRAGTPDEIDSSFAAMVRMKADALWIASDAFFASRRGQLVVLTARLGIPAIHSQREVAAAGGLIAYGSDVADSHRQAGIYVGRILKGTKPSELPVLQPTKFELAINLRTAKSLGITIPTAVLARADEVIE
jgi:putative ABC transport system substrate-binding protein